MRLRNGLRILSVIGMFLWSTAYGQSTPPVVQEPTISDANLAMLQVPDGFISSPNFNGYVYPKMGSSIIMTLIDGVNSPAMDNAWEQDSTRIFMSKDELISNKGYTVYIYKEKSEAELVGKTELIKIIQYTVFIGSGEKVLWLSIAHTADADGAVYASLLDMIKNADLSIAP